MSVDDAWRLSGTPDRFLCIMYPHSLTAQSPTESVQAASSAFGTPDRKYNSNPESSLQSPHLASL